MIFVYICPATTVKDDCQSSKKRFEDDGVVRKVTLMRKILNKKLDSFESMESYISMKSPDAYRIKWAWQ